MRTPEVKEYLVSHYHGETRKTATMMLGPPGIGKSVGAKEAAKEISESLDLPFVDYTDQAGEEIIEDDDDYFVYHNLPLVECEPSDILGIPRDNKNEGHAKFKPLLWARVMERNPGMLLLDDFLDVQRYDLFSAGYKVTLERRAGYLKLNDGVMVVGASNTPEHSSLSQMIPAPLANRMILLEIDSPTVREWGRWMNRRYGDEWDKRVLSFLKRYETDGYLLRVPPETEVLDNFPSPRSMTKAAIELKKTENSEVIQGLLGQEVGQKLKSFLDLDVDIEELIENPMEWEELSVNAKFMICTELANWLKDAEEPRKGFPLLDEMTSDSRQYPILTFITLSVKDLEGLFKKLFNYDDKYTDLINDAISDKQAISGRF